MSSDNKSDDPKTLAADIARELRENPNAWTQSYMARRADGKQALVLGDGACSWCLVGHIERRLKDRVVNHPQVLTAFYNHLDRKSIVCFNDAEGRTVADVIELCEKVAAL